MSEKPNCYKCMHRKKISGSAHSKCVHPAYSDLIEQESIFEVFSIMGKRAGCMQASVPGIEVIGNSHGKQKGWFNHPFNFDPTWLISCTGFKTI